jgi:hypothetical protein
VCYRILFIFIIILSSYRFCPGRGSEIACVCYPVVPWSVLSEAPGIENIIIYFFYVCYNTTMMTLAVLTCFMESTLLYVLDSTSTLPYVLEIALCTRPVLSTSTTTMS